jgi:uncharacterized membrane protein
MTLFLAFLIGLLGGLRSLTAPAIVAWAAHLGLLKLDGTLALIGSTGSVWAFTVLAVGELVADKTPWIPSRKSPPPLAARILLGGLTGACIAAGMGSMPLLGAAVGATGGLVGAFGGYELRTRAVKAAGTRDLYIALLEDLICIDGCLWVVSQL